MSGNRALRGCMQALVLLNLAFVQMTGVASMHWILPLYSLALAAPLLERYREHGVYRLLWNGGIVCFFTVLLRHALSADLAYVLEDGLVLAVLCQVHLLNNLRSSQRPDLLFFNAFLIAIITGFMNRGLGFPIAFAFFIPCFVVGLQLLNSTRDGRVLQPEAARRLARDGVRRAGVILALSFVVFLFWPRNFERRAYFHGKFDVSMGGPQKLEVGFNEKLDLNRSGSVESSNSKALRVRLISGNPEDVSPLWRGGTLGATEGGLWLPLSVATWRDAGVADEPWKRQSGALVRRLADTKRSVRLEVVRFDQETERLFAPLQAEEVRLGKEHGREFLRPRADATFDVGEVEDVRYELSLSPAGALEQGGRWDTPIPDSLAPYLELPEDGGDRIELAHELADRLVERLPEDAEQHQVVTRIANYLSRTYKYLPPGAEGAPKTLGGFLRGDAGGHCEFFASALGTMLRTQGIPCRLATGFRATRWDEKKTMSIGTRDAHVWVEVYDPEAGWYAVDPSPALVEDIAGTSLWARIQSAGRSAWDVVTRFDSDRRAEVLAWFRALPSRVGKAFSERPVRTTLTYLIAMLPVAWLLYSRRRRVDPTIRLYRRAVHRTGLRFEPGETPRQLLERARASDVSPPRLETLETATRLHEAQRYAA